MSGSVEVIVDGKRLRVLNEEGSFFGELAIMSED